MSPPLLTAALRQDAHERDRSVRVAGKDLMFDLNLTALEQQFFVEWEVPQTSDPHEGAASAG